MAAPGASSAAAQPAAGGGAPVDDRAEWEQQLKVGDLLDSNCAAYGDTPAGWFVCRVTATTEAGVKVELLYWARSTTNFIERASPTIQPLGSKTEGKYTGPPKRLTVFLQSLIALTLAAVPLHPHQLQRFRFDFSWICDRCFQSFESNEMPAYSCLPCMFDLCVDCFVATGGVDTHPLLCEAPPAKEVKFVDYSTIEFAESVDSTS